MSDDPRRRVPQVDRVVREIESDAADLPRTVVVDAVREAVSRIRDAATADGPAPGAVAEAARAALARRRLGMLTPVINATGVVLHTNLGRAPLGLSALEAVLSAAGGYSNLELDLETGTRGRRDEHVEPFVSLAVGAEASIVVNNNAAGVLLVCTALARGRGVVVSRGELVEIGGSFRIPEILAESGATIVEVGTTNRTHLRDYERAVDETTGLVLKVHASNYRIVGFTSAPSTSELAGLAHAHGVPLVYDVGSGLLSGELEDEPSVSRALADGADLVCFSGDKLLGGPQAGVVCGSRDLVARLASHPLVRALRPGKLTIAALSATVLAHLRGELDELPAWRMMRASPDDLRERASALRGALADAGWDAEVAEGESVPGGGSLPGRTMATVLVRLAVPDPDAVAAALRTGMQPVVARVERGAVVMDLRTVLPGEDAALAEAVVALAAG